MTRNNKNVGVIKVGSNSIRMLIAEKSDSGFYFRELYRKGAITKIGEGFNAGKAGTLKQVPVERSIGILGDFFDTAKKFDVGNPFVVATGVIRQALNRDDFVSLVSRKFGKNINIISGDEEACFTCNGVLSSLNRNIDPQIIFDVGGGSTEFVLIKNGKKETASLNIGAVVLTQDHLYDDPPSKEQINKLFTYIEGVLDSNLCNFHAIESEKLGIIGVGGSVSTIAKMIKAIKKGGLFDKDLLGVTKTDIETIFENIRIVPAAKRLMFKGLERGREDTILAGMAIVLKTMEYLSKNEMAVSHSGILEGMLIKQCEGEENE